MATHVGEFPRRAASWQQRIVASFGALWTGLWLWASLHVLLDDAPDLPWPYNALIVAAQSAIVVAYALTCWRPALGIVTALPIVITYAVVLWLSAATNDGEPLLAVVIFAGPQVLLFWLIAALDKRPFGRSPTRPAI